MSAEVLIERGIGATRALVIDAGAVVAAHIERDDDGPVAGAVHIARLTKILEPGRRGIIGLGDNDALIEPLPLCPEGGLLRVEVTRGALHEAGRPRLAKLRAIDGDASAAGEVRPGPDLAARLAGQGRLLRLSGGGEDRLEAAGWGEAVEAARSGHVGFAGGLLTISPTPAMTVIDIDGPGDPEALALASAVAVAAAIARFDIQGSIGVDFPTLAGKAARVRIGELLDTHLPAPFERTAVNGWGFVQIIRPRRRASFVEAVRAPGFAALELLRRAARSGAGKRTLAAHPAVIGWLDRHPELVKTLARTLGGDIRLHADPSLAMEAGDVHS